PAPLADVVEFAIYQGFRKENILSLRIEKIRFHDLTETGEVDLVLKRGRLETKMLGRPAVNLLKRLIASRKEGYVFLNPQTGNRWFSIHKAFNQAVRKLRLQTEDGQKITFHDLRHVFGTWLRDAGVSLDDIRPLMGHKDRKMTDHYITEDRVAVGMQLNKIPVLRRQ
ncbi:MAG TPA: tyrosine-type recombinase/integrase, partial [archaeon]|nr:tyrosine-type recombinase/integrase [archaeon]